MSSETKTTHITPVGGNVFADLGFRPEAAAELQAKSQRIIAMRLATLEAESDDSGESVRPEHKEDPA